MELDWGGDDGEEYDEIEFYDRTLAIYDDNKSNVPFFFCRNCEKLWVGCVSKECLSETGWQLCTVIKHYFDMEYYQKLSWDEKHELHKYMKANDLCLRAGNEGPDFKICGEQDCIDTRLWGEDSITGPDGGYGSEWKCGVCSAKYYFNDK